MRTKILSLLLFCSFIPFSHGKIIHIPADFSSIQAGVDFAAEGDTVLVAPGLYLENIRFKGQNIVLTSRFLFSGNKEDITGTIIDGGKMDAVVLFNQGETENCVLSGFTLKNGSHPFNVEWPVYGGGIICLGTSPTIRNNYILNCSGSVFNYSDFGGIYCLDSEAQISDNLIDSIAAHFSTKLGGIVSHRSSLLITGNTIRNVSGGYIFQGGGISADSSYLSVKRNVVSACSFDLGPESASIRIFRSGLIAENNTLDGELALDSVSTAHLTNNVIQAPSGHSGIHVFFNGDAEINARYNIIDGNWPGTGNFEADPLFEDPGNGNYHLLAASPCIDAGDPEFAADPDNTRSDIGAFPFFQSPSSAGNPDWAATLRLFPNPAKDLVMIESPGNSPVSYTLYSQDGKLTDEGTLSAFKKVIRLTKLEAGLYFIRLEDGKGNTAILKLVKAGK